MKKSMILLLVMLVAGLSANAGMVKSYMHWETQAPSAQGPIYGSTQNSALWVEWNDDLTYCRMLDNTTWRLQGRDAYGNLQYVYAGANGPTMPMTQYQKLVFSSDYSRMRVQYVFGMMGMMTPMVATYNYIGEGQQPAYDYISGNY